MFPSRSGAVRALTAIPFIWVNFALAQSVETPPAASAPDQSTITLPPVSVTAGSQLFLRPPPFDVENNPNGQAITTIGRDRFDNEPAFSIGEILRQSPGVSVKQGNGPRDVGISIRGSNARNGFGIRNIQVFEDGFPVTQPDGLSRTDLTDPHAYSGIDVYRGPSSAMFGNYATGGAINFHTRSGSEIRGVEFGGDFGSFNYFNGYLTAGDQFGDYEYSVFVSNVSGDGFQPNSSFVTTTGNILASYTPTQDDKIHVGVFVGLAGDGRAQVILSRPDRLAGSRIPDLLKILEVAVSMTSLALGSRAEHRRHIAVALDISLLREIKVAPVRLTLAGKRGLEVFLGLRILQGRHTSLHVSRQRGRRKKTALQPMPGI